LTYQEVQLLSNAYWYVKSFGNKEYFTNPHIKGICQTPEITLEEFPEHHIQDPFKRTILAGL